MSPKNEDKADATEARFHETRILLQQVRMTARHEYIPEENGPYFTGGVQAGGGSKGSLSPRKNQGGSFLRMNQGLHGSKEE